MRAAVEALNRRDTDAFAACLHPRVEWEETADAFPGLTGSYRGPREVRQWAEQAVVAFFSGVQMDIDEITETRDGGFLLGTRISARGVASGAETETYAWQVIWLTEERISRRQGPFWAREEALEAAGISE